MIRTLGEIEAMAMKAARGAGMPWSLAEETGRAARWLAARGLPFAATLADELTSGGADADFVVRQSVTPCQFAAIGAAGLVPPLRAGPSMIDRAETVATRGLILAPVARPMLLMPFAAMVAYASGRAISVTWMGARLVMNVHETFIEMSESALQPAAPLPVQIAPARRMIDTRLAPKTTGADVADLQWERLSALAERTYAPATEASRRSGAGDGT